MARAIEHIWRLEIGRRNGPDGLAVCFRQPVGSPALRRLCALFGQRQNIVDRRPHGLVLRDRRSGHSAPRDRIPVAGTGASHCSAGPLANAPLADRPSATFRYMGELPWFLCGWADGTRSPLGMLLL